MTLLRQLALLSLVAYSRIATASSNDDLAARMKARDYGAVDQLARERIRSNPQDEQAYNFVASAALASDMTRREDAIPVMTSCTEKLPSSSICHHRLGQLYGVLAMQGGMMAAIKHGGKIKDYFDRAVELDPKNFEARRDLVQFYLQAPGLVGGSVAKAQEHAIAHGKINALQGKLVELDVLIYRKDWDAAERALAALPSQTDSAMAGASRSATAALGFALLNAKLYPRAQKFFESAVRASPEQAVAQFGLGRALLEANQLDGAIVALERATQLDPTMGAQYRLGIAYQQKGEKQKALTNLQQFVNAKPPRTGKAVDDAKQRIDELQKSG